MDHVYAAGVTCIEFIQEWFADSASFFELVNDVSNPNNLLEVMFPMMSVLDSVFAAQLCLCGAFGGWLNAVMKWWLLEERPYWWVRETDYYGVAQRPVLQQTRHTCETGPGSPSGHSSGAAMLLVLTVLWISHVLNDRKCSIRWWKYVVVPLCAVAMVSVMLARLFVATHFPHQVVAGALVGAFVAPALCIYVVDPFVWRYGYHAASDVSRTRLWHVASACVAVAVGLLTYLGLRVCGWDPLWTVKLAFRWCEDPASIHVTTTPMFALVHSTGHLLGWALSVTPVIAQYRHYTQTRSMILSIITTSLSMYIYNLLQTNINKDVAWQFYALQYVMCTVKPIVLLRVAPQIAMWPYGGQVKQKTG